MPQDTTTLFKDYGFLFGAIFGSLIMFLLTLIKEIVSSIVNRRKENKKFRMQIFSDVYSLHLELIEAVKEKDYVVATIVQIYGDKAHDYSYTNPGLDEKRKLLVEHKKKINEMLVKFESKLGFYLFEKDMKTSVVHHLQRLNSVGVNYKPEQFPRDNDMTEKELADKLVINYKTFHQKEVQNPIADIMLCLLKNT